MRKNKLDELHQYIEELKTIKMELVERDTKFIKTVSYDVTINNNKTIKREKLVKGNRNGDAAIILPLTKDFNVILAVEPRVFTKETVLVDLPAGYIEENEEPIIAANRELMEETGYEAESLIHLGAYYQDQGCSGALNHYYLGLNCTKKYEQSLDEGEFVKYFECTYEEMLELVNMGYIKSLNSIVAIANSKEYIKER